VELWHHIERHDDSSLTINNFTFVGVESLINLIVEKINELNTYTYSTNRLKYYNALLQLFYNYAKVRRDDIKKFIKNKNPDSYESYFNQLDLLMQKVDNLLKAPNEAKKGYFSQMLPRSRRGGKSKKRKNKRSKSRKSRSVKRR